MPRLLRAILFWLFVVTFLVLAPSLVLYTFGFRYNLQTGRIEHTGVISVSTVVRGASVNVDGRDERSTTPTLVKQLRPKDHVVALSKEGFHPWIKTVRSIERETVFIESVVLWADADPLLVAERGDVHLVNPTKTALVSLETGGAWVEAWVEDFQKNNRTLVARFPGSRPGDVALAWSPNGERLLLSSGKEILVVKRDGTETLPLRERAPGLQSVFWDEGQAESLVVATLTETRRMNPASGEMTTLFSAPVETLLSQNDRLLFTRQEPGRTHVVSRTGSAEEVIAILPQGSYAFLESRLPFLLLHEASRGRILLLDADHHDQPILLQAEAKKAEWSSSGELRLLYTNGFETHLFSPRTLQDTLVDRVSRPVTSAAWHPEGTAIILAHQEGIIAYDLHEPGFVQTTLNGAQDISHAFIDDKGSFLYFLGVVDGIYGLYRQPIR